MNIENKINIKSERCLLRNIEPSDEGFVLSLWTNPHVTEFLGGPRDLDDLRLSVSENIVNPFAEEYDLWILVNRETDELIGHCGLLEKEVEGMDEIEVIYVIHERYWGKGYATEAAKMLIRYACDEKKLDNVIALIKPENAGSENVAEKAGLTLDREVIRPGNIRMLMYRINNPAKE